MGYKNYAAYSLENTMAKTPENVYAFLKQLIASYKPKAKEETREIEKFARKIEGTTSNFNPTTDFYSLGKDEESQV